MSGSGISWAICTSAPCSRQITTPAPHHSVFTGRMPFLPPNQQRQSTEGNRNTNNIKIAVKMPIYAGKMCDTLTLQKNCRNKQNMWQLHICTKLTCLVKWLWEHSWLAVGWLWHTATVSDNIPFTSIGQLSLASLRGRLIEYQLRLGKGGNVTSAGWQVTLCDPMWHVSSRSGVATLQTAMLLIRGCRRRES